MKKKKGNKKGSGILKAMESLYNTLTSAGKGKGLGLGKTRGGKFVSSGTMKDLEKELGG